MRISIVLCTYNGESFLREQLDSLLAQTRQPDEIVIADDASTDATWTILQGFARQASDAGIAVDLQRNPANLGYVENFTAALRRATGDLVFLSNQDDVWHPDKLRRMAEEFRQRPELGLLHTDARLVDRDGHSLGLGLFEALAMTSAEIAAEHMGSAFDVLLRRNTVTGATLALRRPLLALLLPVPKEWAHDEWLALGASMQTQVDCLEWQSIDYRQHDNNQIGMRRRTLGEKLLGGDMPKREFMHLIVQRLTNAFARFGELGLALPPGKEEQVRKHIAHALFRAELPRSALMRWPQVFAEACSGRYAQYSSSLRFVLGDLMDLS